MRDFSEFFLQMFFQGPLKQLSWIFKEYFSEQKKKFQGSLYVDFLRIFNEESLGQ